jgi:hypothetical protein
MSRTASEKSIPMAMLSRELKIWANTFPFRKANPLSPTIRRTIQAKKTFHLRCG